jgi:hypothetical protein
MNFFTILFSAILVSQYCHAAPQRGGDPEDEVELVPATNTNTRNPESGFSFLGSGGTRDNGFPVIIVRTSSGGRNPLHTLLKDLFGNSGSTDAKDTEASGNEEIPEVPLSDLPDLSTILGFSNKGGNEGDVVRDDDFFPSFPSIFKRPTSDGEKNCGLLCTMFKRFDTQLKQIEEEVREIRDHEREKENEIAQGDEEDNDGPVNEYTEEVLPDGSIVRTNKTYHTSEDGSSFYSFQSTSFNTFGHNTDSKTEVQTEDKNGQVDGVDNLDEKTVSDNSENNSSPKEYEDLDGEREELEENVGVDDGLFNA